MIFYTLDTETTGTDSTYHEMTEVSIIHNDTKMQLTRNIRCDHPERASLAALKITNKTVDDLHHGDSKIDVINKLIEFINQDGATPDHRVLVGHNIAAFDKRFLHAMFTPFEKIFPINNYVCTLRIMKHLTQGQKVKRSLDASCEMFGIKKVAGASHGAKVDCRNNYNLWQYLVNEMKFDYLPFIEKHPHIIEGVNDFSEEEKIDEEFTVEVPDDDEPVRF
jgi:DNA polymerase III epsilon subunit-like protein